MFCINCKGVGFHRGYYPFRVAMCAGFYDTVMRTRMPGAETCRAVSFVFKKYFLFINKENIFDKEKIVIVACLLLPASSIAAVPSRVVNVDFAAAADVSCENPPGMSCQVSCGLGHNPSRRWSCRGGGQSCAVLTTACPRSSGSRQSRSTRNHLMRGMPSYNPMLRGFGQHWQRESRVATSAHTIGPICNGLSRRSFSRR